MRAVFEAAIKLLASTAQRVRVRDISSTGFSGSEASVTTGQTGDFVAGVEASAAVFVSISSRLHKKS